MENLPTNINSILTFIAILIAVVPHIKAVINKKYTRVGIAISVVAGIVLVLLLVSRIQAASNKTTSPNHIAVGDRFMELNEYEKALDEYKAATEQEPGVARNYDRQVSALVALGRYDDALDECIHAVEREGETARYHYNEGIILYNLGRYDEARKEIQTAVDSNETNARYHHSLGVTLYALEQYDEAIKEVQEATRLEPDNAYYHKNLGVMQYEHSGLRFIALKSFEQAINLEKDNPEYHHIYALALYYMYRYDEACTEAREAIELDDNKAKYHILLLYSLNLQDHHYGGVSEYEKYKEYDRAHELDPSMDDTFLSSDFIITQDPIDTQP